MIESFIEGRLRLRSPLFGDKKMAALLREHLMKIGGITKADVNPRTRGLLLEYDKACFPLERVKRAGPLLERMAEAEKLPTGERAAALLSFLDEMKKLLS